MGFHSLMVFYSSILLGDFAYRWRRLGGNFLLSFVLFEFGWGRGIFYLYLRSLAATFACWLWYFWVQSLVALQTDPLINLVLAALIIWERSRVHGLVWLYAVEQKTRRGFRFIQIGSLLDSWILFTGTSPLDRWNNPERLAISSIPDQVLVSFLFPNS